MCTACLQVSGIKRIPMNTNTVGKESMHDLLDILPAFFFLFRLDKGVHGFQLLEYVCGSTILGIVCDTAKNP